MPDRDHTLRERIAALRERAREVDSQPRLVQAADALRGLLPGDPRLGDTPLAGARRAERLIGQGLASWAPRRESTVRELGLAALQVWQAAAEAQGRGRGERELVLAFTDVVGFSDWALRAGDQAAVELIRELDTLTRRAIARAGGRVVKQLGDGWMLAFDDPDEAATAVLGLAAEAGRVSAGGDPVRLRAGCHRGRPRLLGGDLLGVDVNVAARVTEAAPPGAALITSQLAGALDRTRFRIGPPEPLRAAGAPEGLCVHRLEGRS